MTKGNRVKVIRTRRRAGEYPCFEASARLNDRIRKIIWIYEIVEIILIFKGLVGKIFWNDEIAIAKPLRNILA